MNPFPSVSLANKRCIVTGGTRGIGRAIAQMLATEGARVVICGRSQEGVDKAILELEAQTGTKVAGKAADLRHYKQVEELFQYADECFAPSGRLGHQREPALGESEASGPEGSGLDVLVNNAGVGIFGPVGELSVDDWKTTMETNLFGTFYASQLGLQRFKIRMPNGLSDELGRMSKGYIVNISSLAGANAFAGGAAYNASKFGLNGFSEAMLQDVRSQGVRVSQVMPGSVATEFGGAGKDSGSDWKIWPEDVAAVVGMLLHMPERTVVSRVEVRPARPKR